MKTPSYMEIQRHHVEESKKWLDLRAYAAEVLRRHEAEKASKSKRCSASQHVPAHPKNEGPMQETRRQIARVSALVGDGKSITQANQLSNDTSCQRSGKIVLQDNTVDHFIPGNGMPHGWQQTSSHVPDVTIFKAVEDSDPWAPRENDGQGMYDASFQKLLAAIQSGYPVPPKMNAASAAPVPINGSLPYDASARRKGMTNPDSVFAGSQTNGWEKPKNRALFIDAIRPQQDVSFKQVPNGSNMIDENGRSNIMRKERNSAARISNESAIKHSNGISSGVSKKRKPKRNVRIPDLKVQGRQLNGRLPGASSKTDGGCLCRFGSCSPDCPRPKSVARDAVPISRNEASAADASAAIMTENTVSGQNASPFLGLKFGTSFSQNLGSRMPGVSKNGRIRKVPARKQGRGRKDSPAVAARQSTA